MAKRSVSNRPAAAPGVRCEDLITVRDGGLVLYRVDLEIPAGRRTVILGPPASGKSTLIRHIVGLDQPDAGDVHIADSPLWSVELESRNRARRDLSVMLSGTSPFASQLSSMSVYDNVAYQLRLGSLSDDAIDRRVTECLAGFDLTDFADLFPEQISDRARRRMALARALAPDTALIVLDAPETVFDPTRDEHAVRAVLDAQERIGATLIVATSNLELARRIAQHLAILDHGRIVAQGTVDLLDGVETTAEFINLCRQLDNRRSPDPDVAQSLIEAADQARRQLHRATPRYYLALLSAILVVVTFVGLYYLLLDAAG